MVYGAAAVLQAAQLHGGIGAAVTARIQVDISAEFLQPQARVGQTGAIQFRPQDGGARLATEVSGRPEPAVRIQAQQRQIWRVEGKTQIGALAESAVGLQARRAELHPRLLEQPVIAGQREAGAAAYALAADGAVEGGEFGLQRTAVPETLAGSMHFKSH